MGTLRLSIRGIILFFQVLIIYGSMRFVDFFLPVSPEKKLFFRQRILFRHIQVALFYLGFRVEVRGRIPSTPFLVASNHLSYVDILVYFSLLCSRFISKKEVLSWPFFGRFAADIGSFFLQRESLRDLIRTIRSIQKIRSEDQCLVFFPEGTSSGGEDVLPFHPGLFEISCQTSVPMYPAAIRYEISGEGSVEEDVCYWKDHVFFSHLCRMMRLKKIRVKVAFGDRLEEGKDRKVLAKQAHESVSRLFHAG